MNITMNNVRVRSIEDITTLMQTRHQIILADRSRESRYACIVETLVAVGYLHLSKKERGMVKTFLIVMTGYADRQVKRLIRVWRSPRGLRYVKRKPTGAAKRTYGPEDIALLIKTDILHKTPNGMTS